MNVKVKNRGEEMKSKWKKRWQWRNRKEKEEARDNRKDEMGRKGV